MREVTLETLEADPVLEAGLVEIQREISQGNFTQAMLVASHGVRNWSPEQVPVRMDFLTRAQALFPKDHKEEDAFAKLRILAQKGPPEPSEKTPSSTRALSEIAKGLAIVILVKEIIQLIGERSNDAIDPQKGPDLRQE